MKANNKIPRQV